MALWVDGPLKLGRVATTHGLLLAQLCLSPAPTCLLPLALPPTRRYLQMTTGGRHQPPGRRRGSRATSTTAVEAPMAAAVGATVLLAALMAHRPQQAARRLRRRGVTWLAPPAPAPAPCAPPTPKRTPAGKWRARQLHFNAAKCITMQPPHLQPLRLSLLCPPPCRQFYKCPVESCNFFKWADEVGAAGGAGPGGYGSPAGKRQATGYGGGGPQVSRAAAFLGSSHPNCPAMGAIACPQCSVQARRCGQGSHMCVCNYACLCAGGQPGRVPGWLWVWRRRRRRRGAPRARRQPQPAGGSGWRRAARPKQRHLLQVGAM
jgi:hypothetical protein